MKKYNRSPAVVRKWKKFLGCGCNHGILADKAAIRTLLKFKSDLNPDMTFHLGDFMDGTAFRTGAKGNKDESEDIDHDVTSGLIFLQQLEPDIVFNGNHEDRIWGLQDSPKAIERKAARDCVSHITNFITGNLKSRFIDSYVITESWAILGPYKLGHGWMFNESAIKDHADYAGNCIIAHLHRAGIERGRKLEGATGICVGMLADPKKLTYANRNRAKSRWTQSFVYGEYCSDILIPHHYLIKESHDAEFVIL